jgi:hypothetical protein
VNEATSLFSFSTTKAAFASGIDPGLSALVGPGWAGLIMITPSTPVSAPDGVCPKETQAAITRSTKTIETVESFTLKFTGAR